MALERLVHECKRADGTVAARITRAADGARMLNVDRVLIADVPLAGGGPTGIGARLGQLFWRGPLAPRGETTRSEAQALAQIGAALEARGDWSLRVYRSAAGVRVIATHALLAPDEAPAREFMTAIGVEPAVVEALAREREYRVPLSPPPQRLSVEAPPSAFPFANPDDGARYETWERRYETAALKSAFCHVLKRLGASTSVPEAATVVELHDRSTRAASSLPIR